MTDFRTLITVLDGIDSAGIEIGVVPNAGYVPPSYIAFYARRDGVSVRVGHVYGDGAVMLHFDSADAVVAEVEYKIERAALATTAA